MAPTIEELRSLIGDLALQQKETDRLFRESIAESKRLWAETDRKFAETDRKFVETDRKFVETDRKFVETDRKFAETDRKFQESIAESNRRFEETDKRIQKAFDLFEQQWGKLMESLVEGDLVRILQQRGLEIRRTSQRVKGSYLGDPFEYDIVAHNGGEIVVVEVKTTLRVKHVRHFAKKMELFRQRMPEYQNLKVYGALAYLQSMEEAERYAQAEGFFVIRTTGSSASLVNLEGFRPKAF
jgi:hypothetical protein